MNTNTAQKLLHLQKEVLHAPGYCAMLEEYRILDQRLLDILPTLTPEQWEAVTDYLGLVFSMHLRFLEVICSREEKC